MHQTEHCVRSFGQMSAQMIGRKLMKHTIRILGLTVLFVFSNCNFAHAQPQHFGGLVNLQSEGVGSGNGAIYGGELQDVQYLRIFGQDLKVATNLQITTDKKVYRGQFGGAARLRSVVRYAPLPNAKWVFVQGGFYAGGIVFPNTTTTSNDEYTKYVAQPVAGAGFAIKDKKEEVSVVANYLWLAKRAIYAQNKPLNFKGRYIDGWTHGQRVGIETALAINGSRWLFLLNASYGKFTYVRNPGIYGEVLGNVRHRYSVTEVSLGVGRKYGM